MDARYFRSRTVGQFPATGRYMGASLSGRCRLSSPNCDPSSHPPNPRRSRCNLYLPLYIRLFRIIYLGTYTFAIARPLQRVPSTFPVIDRSPPPPAEGKASDESKEQDFALPENYGRQRRRPWPRTPRRATSGTRRTGGPEIKDFETRTEKEAPRGEV